MSLLVESGMPRCLGIYESGREVLFPASLSVISLPGLLLSSGTYIKFQEKCFAKAFTDSRQFSTDSDLIVIDSSALNTTWLSVEIKIRFIHWEHHLTQKVIRQTTLPTLFSGFEPSAYKWHESANSQSRLKPVGCCPVSNMVSLLYFVAASTTKGGPTDLIYRSLLDLVGFRLGYWQLFFKVSFNPQINTLC